MELKDLEMLLDAKLDPLKISIERLEKASERVVDILSIIARQEEIMKFIQMELIELKKDTDTLFTRVREIEKDSSNKIWDVLKIIGAAIFAGLIGLFAGKWAK